MSCPTNDHYIIEHSNIALFALQINRKFPALKITWERRHPCLHAFICQDGRAPGCIFMIVCECALMVSA